MKGVASAVPGLSLQALHETGTVPSETDTVTTGGQTISSVAKPPPLTAAQEASVRACIEASGAFGTPSTPTTTVPGATTATTVAGGTGNPGGGKGFGGGRELAAVGEAEADSAAPRSVP